MRQGGGCGGYCSMRWERREEEGGRTYYPCFRFAYLRDLGATLDMKIVVLSSVPSHMGSPRSEELD